MSHRIAVGGCKACPFRRYVHYPDGYGADTCAHPLANRDTKPSADVCYPDDCPLRHGPVEIALIDE